MGKDLAEAFGAAREVFQEVDEALKQPLSRLMFEGPADELTLTENAQPALMAVSLAVVRVLEREAKLDIAKAARFVAGHSLGEYSALAAARAISVTDTARLLKLRGQSMQKAVPVGVGAMAALLGADLDKAKAIAAEAAPSPDGRREVCMAANDNGGDQVVISGHKGAIERALKIATDGGVKRAILLPVSAPFHCTLMQPAADAMEEALARTTINEPVVPVISNVKAGPVLEPDDIRRLLVEQVTGMVRWRESMIAVKALGVGRVVELGAGKVLAGLAKRIDREFETVSIQGPADIEAFIKAV
jgi:[acyl-carrier-protein] S-malonyltransferase